jgi:hypothetical protein
LRCGGVLMLSVTAAMGAGVIVLAAAIVLFRG